MNARDLVELAALAAIHWPIIVDDGQCLWDERLEQYWTASKCRLDRWCRVLREHRAAVVPPGDPRRGHLRRTIEEILAAEVLARVWTAVLAVYDCRRGSCEAEPIARSVLVGQLEVRQRSLEMLLEGSNLSVDACLELDRLRRRCERWSDILIGYLGAAGDVWEYAATPPRAQQFGRQLAVHLRGYRRRRVWQVLVTPLRLGLAGVLVSDSPNPDLNAQVAGSIAGCFPSTLFDSTGWVRTLWQRQWTQKADDAQVLIASLFGDDGPSIETKHALRRVELELRRRRRFEV